MNLDLRRCPSQYKYTPGALEIAAVYFCDTLEDVVRPEKIQGETAIPSGQYKVIIDFSNRFQRLMPLLIGVPNFSGVRIHNGVTDKNTEGCILVGLYHNVEDRLYDSKGTFDKLFELLKTAYGRGEKIYLTIHDCPSAGILEPNPLRKL